jgi:hypothetical protein
MGNSCGDGMGNCCRDGMGQDGLRSALVRLSGHTSLEGFHDPFQWSVFSEYP